MLHRTQKQANDARQLSTGPAYFWFTSYFLYQEKRHIGSLAILLLIHNDSPRTGLLRTNLFLKAQPSTTPRPVHQHEEEIKATPSAHLKAFKNAAYIHWNEDFLAPQAPVVT